MPPTATSKSTSAALALLLTLWCAAVCGGWYLATRYEQTASDRGIACAAWPDNGQLTAQAGRWTLVMFAHPHCPCTRSSVSELARLMAECAGRIDAHVVFLKPVGTATDWEQTDLWSAAETIPGVSVHRDVAGRMAQLFGVKTSGETLLFDEQQCRRFHGGLTVARGHEGDSAGRSAIVATLFQRGASQPTTVVYGCSLFEDESAGAQQP